jgi:hypothetical protein
MVLRERTYFFGGRAGAGPEGTPVPGDGRGGVTEAGRAMISTSWTSFAACFGKGPSVDAKVKAHLPSRLLDQRALSQHANRFGLQPLPESPVAFE